MRGIQWMLATAAVVFLAGCSSDSSGGTGGGGGGGNDGESATFSTSFPVSDALGQALADATGLPGRTSSQTPASWARVGTSEATLLAPTSYASSASGQATQTELDADGDGTTETVDVFSTNGGTTFVAWEGTYTIPPEDPDDPEAQPTTVTACHLAWEEDATRFWIRRDARPEDIVAGEPTSCLAAGSYACRYGLEVQCSYCDELGCSTCSVDGLTASCAEPQPEPEPDAGADAGTDAGSGEDAGADTGEPGVGECDPACLTEFEVECCTGCDCGTFDCTPVCPEGTDWDCEQQCCFNFDVLRCEE